MSTTTLITPISHKKFTELRVKGIKDKNEYKYFFPGMAWFCPWLFDPHYFSDPLYRKQYSERYFENLLSLFYWHDWCRKRPPITVMLPNREVWCIDSKPDSHYGWQVKGSLPNITVEQPLHILHWEGELQDGKLIPKATKSKFLSTLQLF